MSAAGRPDTSPPHRTTFATLIAVVGTLLALVTIGVTTAAQLLPGATSTGADRSDAGADLHVVLSSPAHAAPGGHLDYRLTISNTGQAAAPDVVVTSTLPAALIFLSATDDGVVVAPGRVRWSLGELGAGDARTVHVAAAIPSDVAPGAVLALGAEARTAAPEDDLEDNRASADVTGTPVDLQAAIGSTAPDVRPGEVVTHTVTLYNVSQSAAETIVVTATLGAGAAWVRDTSAGEGLERTAVAGGMQWSRAAAPGVWTASFDLVTRVPANAAPGGAFYHLVQINSTTVDANLGNNVAVAQPMTIVVPDLRITKTGPGQAAPGAVVDYTLTYANRGTGAAPRTRITDTLPAELTFISASPAATVGAGGILTWDLGRLPAGDEGVVQIHARAAADLAIGRVVTNHAVIGSASGDANPEDNAGSAAVGVVAGPPATVHIAVPAEVAAGSTVQVTADVRDAAGNPVADDAPVQLTASLGQVEPASAPTRGGRATFAWRPGSTAGAATLTARAETVQDRLSVRIQPGAPDTVRIVPSPATATVGQTVTLAIEVRDAFGNFSRDGTIVQLSAPDGVFAAAPVATAAGKASSAWRHTGSGTFLVTAEAGDVATGVRITLKPDVTTSIRLAPEQAEIPVDDGRTRVWATVDDRFGNPVDDGVRVTFSASGGGWFEPVSAITSGGLASATFVAGPQAGAFPVAAVVGLVVGNTSIVVRPADLALGSVLTGPRGVAPGAQIFPGDEVTYVLGVQNNGRATARGVVLGTALEERVRLRDVATSRSTIVPTIDRPGLPKAPARGYTRSTWSLPDLATGERVTLTLRAVVDRETATPWTGFDLIFFRSAITTTTAEASAIDLVRAEKGEIHAADLFVDAILDTENSSIRPGGQLVYDVSFGNGQAAVVGDTVITSTLPAFATFDHWQPDQTTVVRELGAFNAAARTLRWAFDGPYRQNHALRLWLKIDADAPPESILEHQVDIGSSVYDIDLFNNTVVTGGARLKGVNLRSVVTGPATAAPGEKAMWQLTVRNAAGQDSATEVAVNVRLPDGITVTRVTPPPASQNASTVRWALEQALVPGAERRFEIEVAVPPDARTGTAYPVWMEATSTQRDAFAGDNAASWTTRVAPGPAAALNLSAGADHATVCSDETVRLEVVATDRAGNLVADGSLVRWTTTGGVVDAAETPTLNGRAGVTLAPGSKPGSATVTATIDALSRAAEVDMPVGPPGRLTVAANPDVVGWDGTTDVTVVATDACGNPVADRWPITLEAERGEWPDGERVMALPTVGGKVAATLVVGAESGPLRVIARYGTAPREVEVTGEAVVTVLDRPAATATPVRPVRWEVWLPWVRKAGVVRGR